MFLVDSYGLAIALLIITMLCWGSWPNTQKLASKSWRFELFYWDYVLGIVLLSLLFAFTLGSSGEEGRPFLEDLSQADSDAMFSAFIGGAMFNLANILFVAAIAYAGMSVAFPVGGGLALVIGVTTNYLATPAGDPLWLFAGVALIALAIVMSALASYRNTASGQKVSLKGIGLAVLAGVLFGYFYRFIAASMSTDFATPEAGLMTPYSAVFIFALGVLASNVLLNTIFMRKPIEGAPVSYADYFKGSGRDHLMGVLGGVIWCVGLSLSIISAGQASFAVSFGLSQGNALVAAIWGVFIWREFKGASSGTNTLVKLMFIGYVLGLVCIIWSRTA